ncbi:response regulator [Flavihumibacter petaseus]|uniref:Putative two-component response regulator n=1 Tax=Flavihumibacter petaseus NBRC 106054 TaxID=1220578 RepID=A0A0E9N5S3_9BACT|nr:response regulator [Flavihumibacter petaseus]GAO45169.1 putative two-component response regulator [Flavihumibacter petaseus NBRC 106054]
MKRKKILLIEDNDDVRSNTAEILELSNYEVIVAENGKIGVEKAMEHRPDLIICDIMMPVLDGYGVLHAINRNAAIKHTPFIFLTAKSEKGDFRKGMESGADDYITKPFSGSELLNAVDSRLRKWDLMQKDLGGGLEAVDELQREAMPKDLHAVAEAQNSNIYKKKQVIYAEGNHPGRLFYILEGKVKTYRTHEDGKELVTGLFGVGDFIGHIALLEGTTYKDTAIALDDCRIALVPRDTFETLLNGNPEMSRKFLRLLASNINEKEQQLVALAYNSLRRKVADALMQLRNKYKTTGNTSFEMDISRENLASIAGTATESLIRTLSDFKSEGLIDIKGGKILLLQEKKLQDLLN